MKPKRLQWAIALLGCLLPTIASAQTSGNPQLYAAFTSAGTSDAGFYKISTSPKFSMSLAAKTQTSQILCGTYTAGNLYAVEMKTVNYYQTTFSFKSFDIETGESTDISTLPSQVMSIGYDASSKSFIGYSNMQQTFYRINPENGERETIVQIPQPVFNAIAVDNSGSIFATTTQGELYNVNLNSASATLIGNTGKSSTQVCHLTFDRQTSRLFLGYVPSFGSNIEILELNIKDASATPVGSVANGQMLRTLFSASESSQDDSAVPGIPTDIAATFKTPGGKSATLSAKAPTMAFDQTTSLHSPMTLTFFVDDKEVGKAENVAPGATASVSHTFTADDVHWIKVTASNNAGESPVGQFKTFVGFDTPQKVTDATLEIDDQGNASVKWQPSEIGESNGDIDKSKLVYEVKLYPDNSIVEASLKQPALTQKLPGKYLQNYRYGITPVCGDKRGAEVFTNYVAFGESIRLPYVEKFDREDNWLLHSTIDENNDGTWDLFVNGDGTACRYTGGKNQAADWLFTPRIKMRAGVTYTIDFVAIASFNTTSTFNIYALDKVEVPFGGVDVLTPLKQFTIATTEYTPGSASFTPETDGFYHFAIYTNNYPNAHLTISQYVITASGSNEAPAEVENLTIEPAAMGELKATVSFNAPTKLVNGTTLAKDELTAIEIYRGTDKTAIVRFENPKPGEKIVYVDENAVHGTNTYTVTCFSDLGNNAGTSANVWVGEDVADVVNNLKVAHDKETDMITLTWAPPTKGYQGGYVNFDALTYDVQFFITGGALEDYITLMTGLTECKAEIPMGFLLQFMSDSRASMSFVVTAVSSAGSGFPKTVRLVTGDAYKLPFKESFAGGNTSTLPWSVTTQAGSGYNWSMVKEAPKASALAGMGAQDNDGGMAMFFEMKAEVGEARLLGPRINIADATEPIMTFYMYHRNAPDTENNWLVIEGQLTSGEFVTLSEKIPVDGFGWVKHEINLRELAPADLDVFSLVLHGRAASTNDFYIDNITISDGQVGSEFPRVTDLTGVLNADETKVNLSWSEPETGGYTLIGYYVYRDGNKVSNNYTTATNYEAPYPVDGRAHTYTVQAIYNEGDALMSNEVTIASSAIEGVTAAETTVSVDGQVVTITGTDIRFAVVNASGVIVKSGTVSGSESFELTPGIYIVKAGSHTTKCVVR